MAIDMDYYRKIQNMYGANDSRIAQRYEVQNALDRDFGKTLDAYTVTINDIEQDITILKTSNLHIKKIKSRPNEIFYIGQFVYWHNSYWLITEVDTNNDIITYGKMEECNHLLKWQNENGEIIERWAVIASASKYNDGTDGNNVITLGSDQLAVIIPVDEDSLKLKKSMSKKFFIDNNALNPTAYELTGTGNVTDTYNGHGVTSWIVKEVAYSPTDDDLKYGVCNYIAPALPPTPPVDETVVLSSTISGSQTLKVGYPKTYSVIFMDKNGVEKTDVVFTWNIVSEFTEKIVSTINGQSITLKISNEDYVDENLKLQVVVDGAINSELLITVAGLF